MAADDQQEKSLFARIKNCVLTELSRKTDDLPRSPCPSRGKWRWSVDRESVDGETRGAEQRKEEDTLAVEKKAGVEGLRKSHGASDESGTKGVEEKFSKLDSAQSENRPDAIAEEGEAGRANDRSLPRSNQFQPRRYYIKMQNPEAPPCCDSSTDCKICPPKTRTPKSFDGDNEKYHGRPFCRCSGSADYHQ